MVFKKLSYLQTISLSLAIFRYDSGSPPGGCSKVYAYSWRSLVLSELIQVIYSRVLPFVNDGNELHCHQKHFVVCPIRIMKKSESIVQCSSGTRVTWVRFPTRARGWQTNHVESMVLSDHLEDVVSATGNR